MPTQSVYSSSPAKIHETQENLGRLDDAVRFPKVVLIDTVSFCNLECSMCVHKDMTRTHGYMSEPLFEKIIDEIAVENPDARVWMVFFGEALMLRKRKPTIFDKIRFAKGRGLTDVVLNSNANLLDEETAQALIDCGLDAIYIGIDAFTPEAYARIRVGGDYGRVVRNVRHLLRLKREQNAQTPRVFSSDLGWSVFRHRDVLEVLNATQFRLDRDQSGNLLYGAGIHYCPGASLARLELRLFFESLLSATREITLSSGYSPVRAIYPDGGYSDLRLRVSR